MEKEKYTLYALETTKELINKEDRRISRLFWFTIGFLVAILLTTIIFMPNAK